MAARHFLSLLDLDRDTLLALLDRASQLRRVHREAPESAGEPMRRRTLGMIFERASTRTRVSFEAGMAQLGGTALFLSSRDTQLGRGEPIADTARVLSGMVDAVMIRAIDHATVEAFAAHSRVPVINGLTDRLHPCQLLADLQTFRERLGELEGRTVAWIGDGNNVCQSYINAARLTGFHLRVSAPEGYGPDPDLLAAAGEAAELVDDPREAAAGADLVVTDVWASMGQEAEQGARARVFADYRVDAELMARAAPQALFMHCLPAHRGEEVTAEVLDGPQSAVWDEAENRLHAQKALLEHLIAGGSGA